MPIDILLPFWGKPEFLYEAVDSVRAQTVSDWRLVVVDDAYPDPAVAEYFDRLDDDRVEYHRNETNAGITENYRRCLTHARTDLVVFLGCDDVMHPSYLEVVLAAAAEHPDAAVIQPGVEVIDETGSVTRPLVDVVKQRLVRPRTRGTTVLGGERLAVSLLHGNWLYWPSLVLARRTVERVGFRDQFPMVQDLALVMDILVEGGTLVYEPTVCFSYRRHRSSASSAGAVDGSRFEGERRYYAIAEAQSQAAGWSRAARAARLRLTSRVYAATLVPAALRQGGVRVARPLLRYAFGLS